MWGRFHLKGPLVEAGIGCVHDAFDPLLNRRVALKLLTVEERHRADVLRRAWSWASLAHDNVAAVYDAGVLGHTVFVAMEFLEGELLSARLARGGVTVGDAMAVFSPVLDALHAAHVSGIVHGGLQPRSVVCLPDSAIKVLDFALPEPEAYPLRPPYYCSPEQLWSNPVDWRTDVYVAGVIAYELLTGASPFSDGREQVSTVMLRIMGGERRPLFGPASKLYPALDGVLARAMARLPEQRYPSIQHFRLALAGALSPGTS